MPVLINNEVIVPFLSKPMTFIKGLDPLGLQNISEATFVLLLPGLNNVTGRIRFYGFYCWLLQEYSRVLGSTDPAEQRKFIRRAELIIALVNRSTEDEVSGIPGSNYANRQLKENYRTYDLTIGTYNEDGSTDKTYWKHPGGAFRQYYAGALTDIGIISERESNSEVFVRTSRSSIGVVSGEDLAYAFDQNISKENKELFLSCVAKGKIKAEHFDNLFNEFNLSTIPLNTDENALLLKMLLQKDYPLLLDENPVEFRRETIKYVLEYAYNYPDLSDRVFTVFSYYNKGERNNSIDECLTGWYYYQLNEYWQYGCLGVFNGIMDYLGDEAGYGWKNLYQLIDEVVKATITQLQNHKIIVGEREQLKNILSVELDRSDEVELFHLVRENKNIERIAYSIRLIFSLYRSNFKYLDRLKEFGINKAVEKDGDCITYFMKLERNSQVAIGNFLKEFYLKHIIYRHQFVAFRKMSNSSLSTELFIIEDGLIRRVKDNFEPTLTGPRIGRLIRFLSDLQILSEEGRLTNNGQLLLSNLTNGEN